MPRIRQVKLVRGGAGRPSVIEKGIVESLMLNAKTLRQWQIDNKRIATGRSAGSYKVIVNRPTSNAAKQFGIVSGKIVAHPTALYALKGRGPGKAPPVHEIEEWLRVKKIKSHSKNTDRTQLARRISQRIAKVGTKQCGYFSSSNKPKRS